eukprot:1158275-Pelagomonas_calceolata.AAC.3
MLFTARLWSRGGHSSSESTCPLFLIDRGRASSTYMVPLFFLIPLYCIRVTYSEYSFCNARPSVLPMFMEARPAP